MKDATRPIRHAPRRVSPCGVFSISAAVRSESRACSRRSHVRERSPISEHTYKVITLVGSSHTSIEGAVQNAIARAALEEKHLRWFEVVETRGHIEDGKIAHWQVQVKIGATQDE